MTFDLPIEVAAELREACESIPRKTLGGGISVVVTKAIQAHIKGLRKSHNRGKPFESEE